MIVVLCHGCFDLLHPGHVRHLEAARALGDRLVVSVTSDHFVGKGDGRPIFPLAQRMEMLRALRCVDSVIRSPYETGGNNILALRPNIFCKGVDYEGKQIHWAEWQACVAVGAKVACTQTEKFSTTEVIQKCASL